MQDLIDVVDPATSYAEEMHIRYYLARTSPVLLVPSQVCAAARSQVYAAAASSGVGVAPSSPAAAASSLQETADRAQAAHGEADELARGLGQLEL